MNDSSPTSVLVVIPCFRESWRVQPFLWALCKTLDAQSAFQASILLVDDGSGDEEAERLRAVVEDYRSRYPQLVREMLALPENVGKGGTVYAGWQAHRGEHWLLFVDADGSIPAREVLRLVFFAHAAGQESTSYFASRVVMLGRRVERMWYRDIMGQVFHWVVNSILGLAAHDTQCGCKMVPRACFEKARPHLSLHGFAFDLDLLLELQHQGCEIVEVPVDWHEEPGGKIRLLRDPWRMLKDAWALRAKRRLRAEESA